MASRTVRENRNSSKGSLMDFFKEKKNTRDELGHRAKMSLVPGERSVPYNAIYLVCPNSPRLTVLYLSAYLLDARLVTQVISTHHVLPGSDAPNTNYQHPNYQVCRC